MQQWSYMGTGVATVIITFWLVTYYIVILAWAFYCLIKSFGMDVPWKGCQNSWNKGQQTKLFLTFLRRSEFFSDTCYDPYDLNVPNRTIEMNRTLSPVDEYYRSVDKVQFSQYV